MDINKITELSEVQHIKDAAAATGAEVYIIGGALRDLMLNKERRDYDFVVFGDIDRFTQEVSVLMNRPTIRIGKAEKELLRIVKDGISYDFTPAKGATLKEDIARRDFTINTLAYSLKDEELIDISGSAEDIKRGAIRTLSDSTFDDDPLRMLRAFRFKATLKFTIDEKTRAPISEKKSAICRIAGERIRDELFMILAADDSYETITDMAETGLLFEIFPELADSVGCAQNDYHHLDVMGHVLAAYKHLEEILAELDDHFPHFADELNRIIDDDKTAALIKYAILLHDVSKPEAKSTGDDGRVHFYQHAALGCKAVLSINERLRLSKKDSAFTSAIVKQHLRIVPFLQLFDEDRLTEKSIMRYFYRLGGDIGLYVIIHNLADLMASRGIKRATEEEVQKVIALSNTMLGSYFNEFVIRSKRPPLITGSYLIEKLGLPPSPLFKRILDAVYEKQLSREVTTVEEAAAFVKELLE